MKGGMRVWLIVVGVVLGARSAFGIYTPNPAGRWAPGYFYLAGDFMYNSSKDLDSGGEIKDQTAFFARPAFSIAPNVMLYGRLGVMDAKNLDSGFAGGFGVQGAYVLPRAPEWAIGGAFDFVYWDTNADYIEYQFTPAVSYNVPQLRKLTPYAGLTFDFLRGDFREDKSVGPLFGTNYDLTNRVRLDAQFRAVTETGFFVSAGYLF